MFIIIEPSAGLSSVHAVGERKRTTMGELCFLFYFFSPICAYYVPFPRL